MLSKCQGAAVSWCYLEVLLHRNMLMFVSSRYHSYSTELEQKAQQQSCSASCFGLVWFGLFFFLQMLIAPHVVLLRAAMAHADKVKQSVEKL